MAENDYQQDTTKAPEGYKSNRMHMKIQQKSHTRLHLKQMEFN